MNGLTLRISGAANKKVKNSISFQPITLPNWINDAGDINTGVYKKFLESSNADDQLVTLKGVLNDNKYNCDPNLIKFLVAIYMQAELKHPVKCFITRYITKNPSFQSLFSEALASELKCNIINKHSNYKLYVDIVIKISSCLENFPAGAAAIKMIDIALAKYLKSGLECCVRTIREINTLSPTEKNEIFTLGHSTLRLLLHIMQKINPNDIDELSSMLVEIRVLIKDLVFDDDVPMDTKSVCGILYLTIHILVNGPDSWVQVLNPEKADDVLNQLLNNEAAQLCLYSAIATVISVDKLQSEIIQGESAMITLTVKILTIAERCPSESSFILGVTRTLLQLSKALDKVLDSTTGLLLVTHLLSFVWSHLEHYMDSVRHLSAQSLSCVVRYCNNLEKQGDSILLTSLFTALASLEMNRKSYYVGLMCLTGELGARRVMERVPNVIRNVVGSLGIQAVQASATTALESLLQKHVHETNAAVIYTEWIQPIISHVKCNELEPAVLNILDKLMARAVKLDDGLMDYIIPYIKQQSGSQADMKCILMLLSVARKSTVPSRLIVAEADSEWRGIISYDLLKLAAVDATEETRILSLSLIVESPKTTEVFTKGELDLVLWFLKYNINAQAPHFRQLTLSMMKKLIKRLEDSHKVLRRQTNDNNPDYYMMFLEDLRRLCFDSLIQGANYSRRCVALQILVYCEHIRLGLYQRLWNEDYVNKLLMHLDDSYENNKALALDILDKCPVDLLENNKYSVSLELNDILLEASSVKPTDCVSAAYKLLLLRNKLPESVLRSATCTVQREKVTFSLLHRLVSSLRGQLAQCVRCVVSAARGSHMYGLLHCVRQLIEGLDADAISEDPTWSLFIENIILTCVEVNAAVACVVNNSSPEGHLPMDMRGVAVTDHGKSGGIKLEDGRQVTAQMVLLCAWRSVKEVSLLLGEISSRLTISGEDRARGTLTQEQLVLMGEHFTSLLAETKHRGAFEQAYVGFTKLLARLWRCRSPSLHELPQNWLTELMVTIASGDKSSLCATRRSAGLPFMIQALVTTELQVRGNPRCFHWCMSSLLRLARDARAADTAAHCLNILRALYKNAALDDSVAGYVGEGLEVALMGFEGDTWTERNSSTLLFSALIVRIFGVQRSRDSERLCVRNKMTGRIFFLRYPRLYDFMLEKLQEVNSDDETQLRPSLYPILLLLSRLYPSSLEGTVSNLKLVAYIPHVLSCAKSGVMKTRQLAAKAMVPLVSPEQYVPHVESMLKLICDVKIKKNYCHGILLQLTRLLDAKPDVLIDRHTRGVLTELMENTCWILVQATGDTPCHLIADEYFKVINLIIWRFPTLLNEAVIIRIEAYLHKLLFDDNKVQINSGRDVCLANALYLYIIISKTLNKTNLSVAIIKSLSHNCYEVVLSALNYLLILHKKFEAENQFQQHLILTSDEMSLEDIRQEQDYVQSLREIIKYNKYLECVQKSLKVIILERNTQIYIISTEEDTKVTSEMIIKQLLESIENELDNVNYIYLESLLNFICERISDVSGELILEIMRVVFNSCSSDNCLDTRTIVVDFLENNCSVLYHTNLMLSPEDKFEYKATFWSTIVTLLEDDDGILRQRTSNVVASLLKSHSHYNVISSRSAELLRDFIEQQFQGEEIEIYVLLALLDFKSEVCLSDEITEQCRVFDQNEKHNIFLEETIWTSECVAKVLEIYKGTNIQQRVQDVINCPKYKNTFERLCGKNITVFRSMVREMCDSSVTKCNGIANPKIEMFLNKLLTYLL